MWDSHLFDEDAPFGWFTVSFGMVMVVWEYIVSMKFSEMDSMLAYCVDETRDMVLYRELQATKVTCFAPSGHFGCKIDEYL